MKKYLLILFFITITPSVAFASWWNPFSWFSKSCLIKGNISSQKELIYHLPGCFSYDKTKIDKDKGEKWFCSEQEAINAGWRKATNCN